MFGLTFFDFCIVLLYLVATTWIGLRAGRGAGRSAQEFFLPHRSGKWMLTMATFGSGTSSDQAVTVASKCHASGASGIWYQWMYLFATPFFWIVAPLLRRFRAVTTADIFEARFDAGVARLFCAAGLLKSALSVGLLFKGTGAVLTATSAGTVDSDVMLVLLAGSLLIYTLVGGLAAAIATEFLQSLLTLLFSFLLLPFVLHAVGGIAGMKATLADPAMFDLFVPGQIGVFHIVMLSISGLAMLVMIPHNLGVFTAGRRESDGQVGFVAGAFLKRVCVALWCLTGLAGAAYFAGREIDPDQLYGLIAQAFLPEFMPGLLGLFIASVLAASMSTCSVMLVAGSALLTNNFYRSARPSYPDQHYVRAGRVAMVAVAAAGLGFAFWFPGVVRGLEIIIAVTPIMGVVFWLGFFWHRMNVAGAWTGTLLGYAVWGLTESRVLFAVEFAWQMLFILVPTTLGAVIGSLRTAPPEPERLERFYALSRTPISPGEIVPGPCLLPVGVTAPAPRWWLVAGAVHVPRPERRTVNGFLACAGLVLAMIAGFDLILAL
ncbi:MAG: sodium:solute symporter family protein [Verrucomicrobiota bacterium]